jgi:hemerythrin-like metal-binding protein
MTIVWDEAKLGTGLPDIDAQHKEWLRRYNEFANAVMNGQGLEVIFSTLAFMVQYTETHFSHEEARMAELGCLAQAENRAAHDQFRTRLDEMLSWLENAKPTTVEVVILKQELEDWLTNHISTIDVQLRNVDPDK